MEHIESTARLYCWWLASTSTACKAPSCTMNTSQQRGSYQLSLSWISVPVSAGIGTWYLVVVGNQIVGNSQY